MRKNDKGGLTFSPSDLVTYLASPFASWMDRHNTEHPGAFDPDEETEDQKLIVQTGLQHEMSVLNQLRGSHTDMVDATSDDFDTARSVTVEAMRASAPVVYQAALTDGQFSGYADFLIREPSGSYQVWDAKLARSPKPYYAVQLACYSELLAAADGGQLPEMFGLFLGSGDSDELRVEDFIHFYRRLRSSFLSLHASYTGNLAERPEPTPGADHRRWTSHAEVYLDERDHLWRVAGITSGQIKKLNSVGITTLTGLAEAVDVSVKRLAPETLRKLKSQASLQNLTKKDRIAEADSPPRYELLPHIGDNGEPLGIATLPPPDPADVFFDIEGYPLVAGGLEYLFGACVRSDRPDCFEFLDWWAHDRAGEKKAFEDFVDWAYARWRDCPGMHIYHYAAYEVTALRRLSTRHDSRQDEVDDLLRNNVFVDLYRVVRQGLRIGEDGYSIKRVERLYRPKRDGEVASATDSVVRYAQWIESGQPPDWQDSSILNAIRDYNIDDCESTAELLAWLSARAPGLDLVESSPIPTSVPTDKPELPPEVVARLETIAKLREKDDEVSRTLADLVDFHRREDKPVWWALFDRAASESEQLRDDKSCVADIQAAGVPIPDKQSLIQEYRFDPSQECALAPGAGVMFTHNLDASLTLRDLDPRAGKLALRISKRQLENRLGGNFPTRGSLLPNEFVPSKTIQVALNDVAASHLSGSLPPSAMALLNRTPPTSPLRCPGESLVEAAIRVTGAMDGECLVIQGPPGSGKTYTGSRAISALIANGATVGIVSNSHKAIVNLLSACCAAAQESDVDLKGVKAGGDNQDPVFTANPGLRYVSDNGKARDAYAGGVVAGTAWLFTRPEWEGALDYLFVDEAGQVSLANAVAMSRCARNLVLLGDQMQLEQPIQGSHPGDAGMSILQYALKDMEASKPDAPVFHAVVPEGYGLFLGESRRMHPSVCLFISDSFYEGRLGSHDSCHQQRIELPSNASSVVRAESGIVFCAVEHEGNVQRSDEEAERASHIYEELVGQRYTSNDGKLKALSLQDFLFIAPYNAQVRALEDVLPAGARVGSVDRFQGQEAPVCILSLCSSVGEYGSRGLGFILDRNRINVAISRAQCLAIVVADPRIATSTPSSLDEMRLLNLFCRLSGGYDLAGT